MAGAHPQRCGVPTLEDSKNSGPLITKQMKKWYYFTLKKK
jgi:hypothetical protein